MFKDVTSLLKPKSVAVVGASAKRVSQGNLVIANLLAAKFPGPIIPIHPTAETIDGLRAISSPDELPADIALAVVAIPAGGVTEALKALQRNHVRGAIVFANGFNAPAEQDLRDFLDTSNMVVHGPNCMGLINANHCSAGAIRVGRHICHEFGQRGLLENRHHGKRVSGYGGRLHPLACYR
jgi:acetyltransferase